VLLAGLVTKTTMAVITTAIVAAIDSDKSRINKTVAIITARRIPVRTGINGGDRVRTAMAHAPAVKILLSDRLKSLLALGGVNRKRIDETEAQLRLGRDDGGTATSEEHGSDACGGSCSSADGRASTP